MKIPSSIDKLNQNRSVGIYFMKYDTQKQAGHMHTIPLAYGHDKGKIKFLFMEQKELDSFQVSVIDGIKEAFNHQPTKKILLILRSFVAWGFVNHCNKQFKGDWYLHGNKTINLDLKFVKTVLKKRIENQFLKAHGKKANDFIIFFYYQMFSKNTIQNRRDITLYPHCALFLSEIFNQVLVNHNHTVFHKYITH
jgi:hypothetical protein